MIYSAVKNVVIKPWVNCIYFHNVLFNGTPSGCPLLTKFEDQFIGQQVSQ